MNLRGLWQRVAGGGPRSQRDRLAQAIAAVGPLNPEPALNHFLTREDVVDRGQTLDLGVLVVSDAYEPRWLDVSHKHTDGFTTYRYYLLPDRVRVVRPAAARSEDGEYVDVPVEDALDSQSATRLFDLGLALLHRHCEARDAAHAKWRATMDRAAAQQVIEALFGPWDYALRAATCTFELYTDTQAPGVPLRADEMNAWLWMNVMLQGQRTGRPLIELLVDDDGKWLADRCREQKEPSWAREFSLRGEHNRNAEQIAQAFDAFLAPRGWRLLMYGAELGKPLPADRAEQVIAAARRAGFDDLTLRDLP
jgi:hypothetical protein